MLGKACVRVRVQETHEALIEVGSPCDLGIWQAADPIDQGPRMRAAVVNELLRWNHGGGAMLSMTSRLGASRLFADIDREIAPDKPDVEKLMAIALRNGLTLAE